MYILNITGLEGNIMKSETKAVKRCQSQLEGFNPNFYVGICFKKCPIGKWLQKNNVKPFCMQLKFLASLTGLVIPKLLYCDQMRHNT